MKATFSFQFPESLYGNLPTIPANHTSVYVVTDATSAGSCASGTGSSATGYRSLCRWTGTAWESLGGGGGAAVGEPFAFAICTTTGCQPETTFNNNFVSSPNGVTFDECGVSMATMPTVQNVIIDVQTAAGVSIFGTTKLVVHTTDAAGTTNFQSTFANAPQTAAKGAQFKGVVTQSDTGGAALGGFVKCRVH